MQPPLRRGSLRQLGAGGASVIGAVGRAGVVGGRLSGLPSSMALFFFFRLGFVGLFLGARLLLQERLPVGIGDLVVVRVDFREGQETVAVAAVVDEGGLQRRFDPGYLGEIDVSSELAAIRRLEIELLNPIAAQDDDPGLLRVGRIDEHLV